MENNEFYIVLIEKVLELAVDECHALQMSPTMPVSAEYRKAYNDGVCEAAEEIKKLNAAQIYNEIKNETSLKGNY